MPALKNVLNTDDDLSLHRLLGRMLRLHGFRPLYAASRREAIAAAGQHPIDAFIVDLRLGDESGTDVLWWLRAQPRYAKAPVIVLTAADNVGADEKTLIQRGDAQLFYKDERLHLVMDHLRKLSQAN